MKNNLLTICLSLLISSCDSGPSLTKICQSDKALCQTFTADSWCKLERKNVIISSSLAKQTQEDIQKFTLLINLEDYSKCLNLAKQIEHIKLKHKKSLRIENFLKSKQLIQEISEDTKNSPHPSLLFYHWSRYGNKDALNSLLLMEGTATVETPEAQLNLASYYVKRDKYKTLSLLFHALELYKKDEVINDEIFSSLVTIFQNSDRSKQAYIWLKVLHLYRPNNENATEETLSNFAKKNQLKSKLLDKVAYQTLANIKSGIFKTPTF